MIALMAKHFLNFIAELCTSQLCAAGFFILTSNPQLVHGNMERWKVQRVGHISATARADSWLDGELRSSSSKNRLTVSLQYIPKSQQAHARYAQGNLH